MQAEKSIIIGIIILFIGFLIMTLAAARNADAYHTYPHVSDDRYQRAVRLYKTSENYNPSIYFINYFGVVSRQLLLK